MTRAKLESKNWYRIRLVYKSRTFPKNLYLNQPDRFQQSVVHVVLPLTFQKCRQGAKPHQGAGAGAGAVSNPFKFKKQLIGEVAPLV